MRLIWQLQNFGNYIRVSMYFFNIYLVIWLVMISGNYKDTICKKTCITWIFSYMIFPTKTLVHVATWEIIYTLLYNDAKRHPHGREQRARCVRGKRNPWFVNDIFKHLHNTRHHHGHCRIWQPHTILQRFQDKEVALLLCFGHGSEICFEYGRGEIDRLCPIFRHAYSWQFCSYILQLQKLHSLNVCSSKHTEMFTNNY